MTVAVCCKPPWRQTFTAHTSGQPLMSLVLSEVAPFAPRAVGPGGVVPSSRNPKHHTAFPPDAQVPSPRHALFLRSGTRSCRLGPASSTAMGPLLQL